MLTRSFHLQGTGAATAEQAQAIARLQKQLAESQERRKQADESTAILKAEVAELRGELAAQTQSLAVQVRYLSHHLAQQPNQSLILPTCQCPAVYTVQTKWFAYITVCVWGVRCSICTYWSRSLGTAEDRV